MQPGLEPVLLRAAMSTFWCKKCGFVLRCLHSLNASSCLWQVGVNAMLVRICLEAVGTLARALRGGLTSNGRLLRAVLLPVLERLTDPCASVAASAAAAISSLCFHGGCATFGQLVAANADYIVDGLCKQLRRLSDHPMSVPDSRCSVDDAGL